MLRTLVAPAGQAPGVHLPVLDGHQARVRGGQRGGGCTFEGGHRGGATRRRLRQDGKIATAGLGNHGLQNGGDGVEMVRARRRWSTQAFVRHVLGKPQAAHAGRDAS